MTDEKLYPGTENFVYRIKEIVDAWLIEQR